jgi:hypothetical protein
MRRQRNENHYLRLPSLPFNHSARRLEAVDFLHVRRNRQRREVLRGEKSCASVYETVALDRGSEEGKEVTWVYILVTFLIQSHEQKFPCPAGLKNCQVEHIRIVTDTVGVDTSFFCQRDKAVRRLKFLQEYFYALPSAVYNETTRLDSMQIKK